MRTLPQRSAWADSAALSSPPSLSTAVLNSGLLLFGNKAATSGAEIAASTARCSIPLDEVEPEPDENGEPPMHSSMLSEG